MLDLVQDLRLGARQLWRRPAFALVAIASLALGIGANTALFSVVNAVLLRDVEVADADRLVEIYSSASDDFPQLTTSYPDLLSIREGADALQDLAGHAFVRGILSSGGKPVLATGEAVTANYFALLGVRPALGRAFLPEENVGEGQHAVVVLSHGLWQRRFGGRNDILGQKVQLSGVAYTVVGVAARGFNGLMPGFVPEFWVPVMMVDRLSFAGIQSSSDTDPAGTRIQRRGDRWLFVKGRLAAGRSLEEARAQVETVFARLRSAYPATNERVKPTLMAARSVRFHPMVDGYAKAASGLLLAAVALVLVVACANVASLLLARGASRRRELAVRAAIGASRARLVRQLLSESLVLAVLGGGLGGLLADWLAGLLTQIPADMLPVPVHFDFHLDGSVLAFTVLVSLVSTALFGLVPALSASKPDLVPSLKADATGAGPRRRRFALRDTLVVGQLALSQVLLVAGALLGRGLLVARAADLGYDPAPVSSLRFNLAMNGYEKDRALALRKRIVDDLRGLPGVAAVSLASRLPFAPDINMEGVQVEGHHQPKDPPTTIDAVQIGPDYFRAIGVPLVEGRPFGEDDLADSRRVVIVNQAMARRYWPGRSAVGQQLYTNGFDHPPHEVIGVARDHKVRAVDEPPRPYLHFPMQPSASVALVVRTAVPAERALPMLRAAILKLEPDIVFTEDVPAAAIAAGALAATRIGAVVLGAFGALALVLAAVGLYGVIACWVGQRTREVGVRIALGARRSDVASLVLRQGGRLALAGVGLGAVLAALVGRVLRSLLYGVSPLDPWAFAVAAAVLVAVAAAANLVPALAAARVDPIRAMRAD